MSFGRQHVTPNSPSPAQPCQVGHNIPIAIIAMTTASERAEQLAKMPMDQAPYPAIALIKHLSAKYGACGELYYHAYTCYAKYVENLPGGSEDLEAKNFFLSREAAAEAIRKQVPSAWHNIFRSDNMIP